MYIHIYPYIHISVCMDAAKDWNYTGPITHLLNLFKSIKFCDFVSNGMAATVCVCVRESEREKTKVST